jgi:hypothetical protein
MTKKEYAAYQAAFASFKEEMGLANISTGLLRCPDCKVDLEGCDCPKCGKNMIEFPNEAYFSWNACDCCGRPEGGDRMDANGWNPTTQEIEEFVICTDCEYYAEYGRLDDTTMDEISQRYRRPLHLRRVGGRDEGSVAEASSEKSLRRTTSSFDSSRSAGMLTTLSASTRTTSTPRLERS